MKFKVQLPVVLTTVLLVAYAVMLLADVPMGVIMILFVIAPFFLIWTAYAVLRWDEYTGQELGESEEWAYEDRRQFYK
jgi:hypothetical protein